MCAHGIPGSTGRIRFSELVTSAGETRAARRGGRHHRESDNFVWTDNNNPCACSSDNLITITTTVAIIRRWWWWCYNCNKSGHALWGRRRRGSLEYNIHAATLTRLISLAIAAAAAAVFATFTADCRAARAAERVAGWLRHNKTNLWIIINPPPLQSRLRLSLRRHTAAVPVAPRYARCRINIWIPPRRRRRHVRSY